MKPNSNSSIFVKQFRGFTLVELLVVITIIAILVTITVPFVSRAMTKSKVATARTDMANLKGAIQSYHNDYSRFPSARGAAPNPAGEDLTFSLPIGEKHVDGSPYDAFIQSVPLSQKTPPNSDLMSVLMAVDFGANKKHGRNPKKSIYLTPKSVSGEDEAGVGPDGVFRDPFGNPYVITVDYNGDNKVSDRFYRLTGVSEGASIGLVSINPNTPDEEFVLQGTVMIWSFGPDRQMHSRAHALDLQDSYEDADWCPWIDDPGKDPAKRNHTGHKQVVRTNKNTDNILGWR
jgi:prepilin-type N-terminal cleavage/methylation domain-containing protein